MMSVVIAQSGHVLADQRDAVQVALAVVGAAHRLQDARGARPAAAGGCAGRRTRSSAWARIDVLAHVRRVRARVADAVDAVDRVDRVQQLGEPARLRAQARAVGVDVLAEQRDLADAVGGERAHLVDELLERPRDLAPARRGHDAERALHVAAGARSAPSAWTSRARLPGRWPVKPSNSKKPWAVSESLVRNSASLWTWPGPNATSTNGNCAEHLVLDRLRPAAADADHALRVAALERPRLVAGATTKRSSAFSRIEQVLNRIRSASVALGHLARSRATRACPSCARSRARSSGTRRW